MAKQLVDEVFDIPKIEGDGNKLDKVFDKVEARIIRLNTLGADILNNNTFKGNVDNLKAMQEEFSKLTNELTNYNKEAIKLSGEQKIRLAELKLATEQAKAATVDSKKALLEETDAIKRANEERKKAVISKNEEAKINAELTNSYKQLELSAKASTDRYKHLAAQLGQLHPLTVDAQKDAANLNAQLKAIDAGAGIFNRNVGNYKSGFDGLGRSMQGLLREIPSVRSLDQLFLSWSNQLPMVGDEISKVRKEITQLRKDGKETSGVLETSLRSLVSWQTLLVVGTIILTQYGAKIVEFMQKIVVGTNDAEKAQEALNKAYSDASVTSAIENVNKLRTDIQLAKEGVLDKTKVLKEYNDTIGKTTGEVKSLDEAEKDLGKNAQAYIQFTLLKAASNYALQESAKKSVEAVIQQQKTMDAAGKVTPGSTNPIGVTQMLFGAISAKSAKEDADQLLNIGENFRKDAAALSKKYGFDFFQGTENPKKEKNKKDNNEILKQEIDNQKAIFDAEENGYEMRLGAMDAYFELRMELNKREGKNDIAFKHEFDLEETKMNKKLADDLEKIRQDAIKKKEKEDKDELDRLDKLSKEKYTTIQQGLNDVELAAKAEGLSAEEVYQKKMDYLVMHINDLGLNAEEQKKIIEAAQNYEIKVIEETQKAKDKADAHELANKKRLYSDLKKLGQETFQFINALISASIDRQIRDAEKAGEANDTLYAERRAAIERSAGLEKEKTEQLMVLADQEKADKLKIQADIAAAKQKQARIDKAIALGTIAINTATAISKAVAEFPISGGLPFSAIAAAIGLAQAAVVLATPIPEYSTGVKADDPYNGLAWISEKNEAELKIDKDGTMRLYTEPTMIYKQQGDTILSNKELQQVLRPSQDGTVNQISYDELIRANAAQLKQQTKELAKVLRETASPNDIPAVVRYQINMERARA